MPREGAPATAVAGFATEKAAAAGWLSCKAFPKEGASASSTTMSWFSSSLSSSFFSSKTASGIAGGAPGAIPTPTPAPAPALSPAGSAIETGRTTTGRTTGGTRTSEEEDDDDETETEGGCGRNFNYSWIRIFLIFQLSLGNSSRSTNRKDRRLFVQVAINSTEKKVGIERQNTISEGLTT